MSFAHPERLLPAALAVLAFAFVYRLIERRATKAALTYSNLAFAVDAMRARRFPAVLLYVCLTVGVAGLASAIARNRG